MGGVECGHDGSLGLGGGRLAGGEWQTRKSFDWGSVGTKKLGSDQSEVKRRDEGGKNLR